MLDRLTIEHRVTVLGAGVLFATGRPPVEGVKISEVVIGIGRYRDHVGRVVGRGRRRARKLWDDLLTERETVEVDGLAGQRPIEILLADYDDLCDLHVGARLGPGELVDRDLEVVPLVTNGLVPTVSGERIVVLRGSVVDHLDPQL